VSRVRRRETEVLFGLTEALDGGIWPVTNRYLVFGGKIHPDEDAGWRITTSRPLAEPEVFLSFARLAARGRPSETTILAWVSEHGLLRRRDAGCDSVYLADGTMNQEPMSVKKFQEEASRAYRLLRLFELRRSGDVDALRPRISLQRLHPPGKPDAAVYADVLFDSEPTSRTVRILRDDGGFTDEENLGDETILAACETTLKRAIEPYLAGMQLVFGIGGRLALRCPDLLAAMYWQFAALVDGKRQTDICEGCHQVFAKRRRDQRVCDSLCRSRKYRRKDPDAT
jgi:hypothetical protein